MKALPCRSREWLTFAFLLALATSALAQEPLPTLSYQFIGEDVTFAWQGRPHLILQRSPSLRSDHWESLLSTRGQNAFATARSQRHTEFYRLAQLPSPDSGETDIHALEWCLTEMVINQIQRAVDPIAPQEHPDALTPPDAGDADPRFNLFGGLNAYAWATQPGLIRVYLPKQRQFASAFKLYSSKNSVTSNPEELQADIAALRQWRQASHRFTDLNAPGVDENGSRHFPILDPRALSQGVEGFDYPDDETLGAVRHEALPMPVEWLYRLQDGSLGTLNEAGLWEGKGEASETNPIVARLAYWTDDETSKLNVNTASEGIPWDVPKADTPEERRYATDQPLHNEIQRHPGHPAMTSLSSVLFPGKAANHPDPLRRLSDDALRLIYALTPGVSFHADPAAPTSDPSPPYQTTQEWIATARNLGITQALSLGGLVTTQASAPEITLHGAPRMSMWPLHEIDSPAHRTEQDRRAAELSELNSQDYHFTRRDATSRHSEFYIRSNRHNVSLYKMIMDQTYRHTPRYGHSLAKKYGASRGTEDYASDLDYDKDHYAIALSMFDRIRCTNVVAPNVASPYAGLGPQGPASRAFPDTLGFGTVASLSLIGRNLSSDNGSAEHARRWSEPTLEPMSAGRHYLLSELALVAYATSEVTITGWTDSDGPRFASGSGPSFDSEVLQGILANEHPHYESWTGRRFGKSDVGKTFYGLEIGLLPEVSSPAQGYPRKAPRQSLRLVTGGQGYRGGFDAVTGLKLNGVPLLLWGRASQRATTEGPLISTVNLPLETQILDFPAVWQSTGGAGGPRLFQFGTFVIEPDLPGYPGPDFLRNGSGPLSHWYCQNTVVAEKGVDLEISQEAPIALALSDGGLDDATAGNTSRLFYLRFAAPGQRLKVPGPELNSAPYRSWTRRMRLASHGSTPERLQPITDPSGHETIKGLSVTHGDYRHLALKRVIPSELFNHPASVERDRASHSLNWAVPGGVDVESGARQGPELMRRSLVEGVEYHREILPDFSRDPLRRKRFAPLLGEHYHFPIDPTHTRDFDNGLGNTPDGPYVNSSDDGESSVPGGTLFSPKAPYFELEAVDDFKFAGVEPEHHFARRMAPSPVAFGSIPSAVQANAPWTCLLFRPNLSHPQRFPHLGERGNGLTWERNRTTLEGFNVPQMASVTGDPLYPPDHLWLDLFWMPTLAPAHAASAFATEGKVNLNYQLFPFTYIKRATALHAALKAEELLAIPTSAGPTYKTASDNPNWRHRIDAEETLKQFEAVFRRGEAFMTESEICEQFLIPEGLQWDEEGEAIRAFWDQHRLSGDNTLERPYAGLYSRLTTRSNSFRLHYHIQIIAKPEGSAPDRFHPEIDRIVDERRGSKRIERRLNTRAPDLPNHLNQRTSFDDRPRLERFYEVRVKDL